MDPLITLHPKMLLSLRWPPVCNDIIKTPKHAARLKGVTPWRRPGQFPSCQVPGSQIPLSLSPAGYGP